MLAATVLSASSLAWSEGIVLGQIGPFTVLPVNDAVEVNQGIKAYMAQANKQSVWGNFGASVLGAASQVANQYLGYTALGVFGDGTQKAAPIEYKNVKLNGVLGGGK